MLLDLNSKFKNLKGEDLSGEIDQAFLYGSLASILCSTTPGINVVKAFDWAMKLYSEKKIEIDRADLESLEKVVTDCQQLSNLGKAQLLKVMMKVKLENEAA